MRPIRVNVEVNEVVVIAYSTMIIVCWGKVLALRPCSYGLQYVQFKMWQLCHLLTLRNKNMRTSIYTVQKPNNKLEWEGVARQLRASHPGL